MDLPPTGVFDSPYGGSVLKYLPRSDRPHRRAQLLAVAAAVAVVAGLLAASTPPFMGTSASRSSKPAVGTVSHETPADQQVVAAGAGAAAALPAVPAAAAALPAAAASPSPSASAAAGSTAQPTEPLICDGCTPPMKSQGGPVMGTPGHPGTVTITPVYWAPQGYTIDPGYRSLVNGFLANLAAASGRTDNVFSVNNELSHIGYAISAGQPQNISAPFPKGCTPDAGYTACLSNSNVETELKALIAARNLPVGLGYFYPVFFPQPTQIATGSPPVRSGTDICAYHWFTKTSSGATVVFAVEPYGNICPNGQAPNGNAAADTQIDTLSHEIVESIADPVNPRAWLDAEGANENADMCNGNYGPPVGSTDPSNPKKTRYNQVINGGKYYIQTNWSNAAWGSNPKAGCVQSEDAAKKIVAGDPPGLNSITVGASSDAVAAGAGATITATVVDPNGEPVAGDDVDFRVGSVDGAAGDCGSVVGPEGNIVMTTVSGTATVTYTAPQDGISCEIQAIEGATGQSDEVVVADGSADRSSPTISVTGPQAIVPGETPTSIGVTVTNPGTQAIPTADLVLTLTSDNTATTGVKASQVTMTADGTPVALTGETVDGGEIVGDVPLLGGSLGPGAQVSVQLQMSVDPGTTLSATTGYALHTQIDLAQVSLTTGATNTLASDGIGMSVQTALAPLVDGVIGVVSKL